MVRWRGFVAVAVVAAVAVLQSYVPVAAAGANLAGRVLRPDGVTPATGVVVRLADPESQAAFDSAPTDTDGEFRIEGAPPGEYVVLARDDDKVYLADQSMELADGDNPPLALSLQPAATPVPAQTSGGQSKKKLPVWAEAVIAGAIGVTALILIEDITSESERPATPF